VSFDRVVLIFNPQSTGDAAGEAEKLRAELAERVPDLPVELAPTERAGHARELARSAAGTGAPLVVSVSGDGGYSEVVDGLMQSGSETAVAAVLAAGNANDHRRATGERPLADAIAEAHAAGAGSVTRMDLLRLTTGDDVQWAHSYIGLGLTPVVAIDLEKGSKGSLREIVSVVRTFARFRPFALDLEDGGRVRLDSLVFANIDQMAKFATLSENGVPRRRPVRGRHDRAHGEVAGAAHGAAGRHPRAGPAADRPLLPLPHGDADPDPGRRRGSRGRRRHPRRRRHSPRGASRTPLESEVQPEGCVDPLHDLGRQVPDRVAEPAGRAQRGVQPSSTTGVM